VSRACEQGLIDEMRKAQAEAWLAENQEGILASNRLVEERGVPLARFRQFRFQGHCEVRHLPAAGRLFWYLIASPIS
jgi:hypothetical protein